MEVEFLKQKRLEVKKLKTFGVSCGRHHILPLADTFIIRLLGVVSSGPHFLAVTHWYLPLAEESHLTQDQVSPLRVNKCYQRPGWFDFSWNQSEGLPQLQSSHRRALMPTSALIISFCPFLLPVFSQRCWSWMSPSNLLHANLSFSTRKPNLRHKPYWKASKDGMN